MSKKVIFLSYRRGDSPGYVKSLEEELERYYGTGTVFRDVEDIIGGTKWKQVLEENLRNSAVLLLVIGPRWESLWRERMNDEVNYVEWELNFAHQLGVPVIPVTIGGAMISNDVDLKTVSWLRENQIYDMSDKQGRWENDFQGLLKILNGLEGIEEPMAWPPEGTQKDTSRQRSSLGKTLLLAGALAVGALVVIGLFMPIEEPLPDDVKPDSAPVSDDTYKLPNNVITSTDPPAENVNTGTAAPRSKAAKENNQSYQNISGLWQSNIDGSLVQIRHDGSQNFTLTASDYGSFIGRFVPNQKGKIRITLNAGGSGEFVIKNSGDEMIGWVVYDDGSKAYGSLIKIQ